MKMVLLCLCLCLVSVKGMYYEENDCLYGSPDDDVPTWIPGLLPLDPNKESLSNAPLDSYKRWRRTPASILEGRYIYYKEMLWTIEADFVRNQRWDESQIVGEKKQPALSNHPDSLPETVPLPGPSEEGGKCSDNKSQQSFVMPKIVSLERGQSRDGVGSRKVMGAIS